VQETKFANMKLT